MAAYAQRKADRVAAPVAESSSDLAVHDGLNARSAVTQATATAARLNARAETVHRKPSRSEGLPEPLRTSMEAISGIALDDVTVHRNSDEPAQMQAHAYAQGTDIHLAPGQDRHLPHEAWHVVQQKQGRVRPTLQMARGVGVNDDPHLENEADVMGARALVRVESKPAEARRATPYAEPVAQCTGGRLRRRLVQTAITFGTGLLGYDQYQQHDRNKIVGPRKQGKKI
ncbi:DUF4157 domain-containing protein [Sphingomonas xinjiangensis]|uniref:eCIS core domain-containing protein n=1 Tax=Sphingomonas xinjiangensis TaxID=643568 RepID=A0A840YJV8_9SPHN|nr:DUF4157 domain-containing protein [Sphingomonas xinjiangensis]MBB5711338.1 hypothetical protein [Sphingomonas xinjiangensis]